MFSPAADTMIEAQPVGSSTVAHQTRIDALAAERIEGDRGKAVAADGAGEHDLGSGSARRQRLIGALATR